MQCHSGGQKSGKKCNFTRDVFFHGVKKKIMITKKFKTHFSNVFSAKITAEIGLRL